jgi:hypothetical protein
MDQVVVSGYVYDADGPVRDGEPPAEFCYTTPGRGLDDPISWLLVHLYQALNNELAPARNRTSGGRSQGVPHTISETGDTVENGVGWTVVGGPGRASEPVAQSASEHL